MFTKQEPYGTWKSPVTPANFTERNVAISQLRFDGLDVYWVEDNPHRLGRSVLLRRDALGQTTEALPLLEGSRLLHVATNVYGRGGRAYAAKDGQLVVSDGTDNRVYGFRVSDRHRRLVPLTPLDGSFYGDFEIDLERGLVYAVREEHPPGGEAPLHAIVAIPLDGSAARKSQNIAVTFQGPDFVAAPTLSPDGKKLAWLSWDHPHMPWDQSELQVGFLAADGVVTSSFPLVAHSGVSAYEPRWTQVGDLLHIDDSTGWPNLYRTEGFARLSQDNITEWGTELRTRALHPGPRAFSQPHWQLGQHSYAVLDETHLVCSWREGGQWHIGTLRIDNGQLEEWHLGWKPAGNVSAQHGRVVFLADAPTKVPSIVEVSDGSAKLLRPSTEDRIAQESISSGKLVEWANSDGQAVHGVFYAPRNEDYAPLAGTKPPLLVLVNPVPTTASDPSWDLGVQFWTTRGFAVLQVNPHGSTGWGAEYTAALEGKWGVLDVDDCVSGAQHLVDEGTVDPEKVAIMGRSMGGTTVLKALETANIFSAGVIQSGITDLRQLAHETSKFESFYPYTLLGASDLEDPVWDERNPTNHLDKVTTPLLLLTGGNDEIAPSEGAEHVYETLRDNGVPVALEIYPEEGHTFLHDRAIVRSQEAKLAFFGAIWGLATKPKESLEIANFPETTEPKH